MSNFTDDKTDFNACQGYVVIEPLDTQAKTSSPFVISDNADKFETSRMGKVVSCGSQEAQRGCPCKVGDVIIHKQWRSENFEFNGKHYQFVKFDDIAAIQNAK